MYYFFGDDFRLLDRSYSEAVRHVSLLDARAYPCQSLSREFTHMILALHLNATLLSWVFIYLWLAWYFPSKGPSNSKKKVTKSMSVLCAVCSFLVPRISGFWVACSWRDLWFLSTLIRQQKWHRWHICIGEQVENSGAWRYIDFSWFFIYW